MSPSIYATKIAKASKLTTNYTILGLKLQRLRKSRGWSREKVAEMTNGQLSMGWLAKVERGEASNPSLRHLDILSELYETSVVELLSVSEQKESGDDFQLRFSVPAGVVLTREDIEAARPIMQGVLNAIALERKKASGDGPGSGYDGSKD